MPLLDTTIYENNLAYFQGKSLFLSEINCLLENIPEVQLQNHGLPAWLAPS